MEKTEKMCIKHFPHGALAQTGRAIQRETEEVRTNGFYTDEERESSAKRLKEDPIPAPLSRPFGKGAFSKDEDVLFSNEGNAIHKKEM